MVVCKQMRNRPDVPSAADVQLSRGAVTESKAELHHEEFSRASANQDVRMA